MVRRCGNLLQITAGLFCVGVAWAADPVGDVAGVSLTRRELELRAREQALEFPQAQIPLGAMFRQLERAVLEKKILERYGKKVGQAELLQEKKRIEKTTLMPEKLREIRGIFPSEEDFLKLYILPVYVNRVLYFDFFARDPRFVVEGKRIDFAEWFKREAKRFRVRCYDPEICAAHQMGW